MERCGACGETVVLGGIQRSGAIFCNERCVTVGAWNEFSAEHVHEADVEAVARETWGGSCPVCNGQGPIDLYHTRRVYSALVVSVTRTASTLACIECARQRWWRDLGFTLALGWWAWSGIVVTPLVVFWMLRNRPRPTLEPSASLKMAVRERLTEQVAGLPPGPNIGPPAMV
jgi:hypothetical protein